MPPPVADAGRRKPTEQRSRAGVSLVCDHCELKFPIASRLFGAPSCSTCQKAPHRNGELSPPAAVTEGFSPVTEDFAPAGATRGAEHAAAGGGCRQAEAQ